VLSSSSAPYLQFANAFQNNLPGSLQASVFETPDAFDAEHVETDVVIAVGTQAAEALRAKAISPVLAVMIPQAAYDELLASTRTTKHGGDFSAIYLNQPWGRQLDFIYAALPSSNSIGVLYTSKMRQDLPRLRTEVVSRGGRLIAQEVHSETTLSVDLENILRTSDVLLAVPDSTIFGAGNARNILLSTYRQSVPLIGWSQAYVNAGAIAAIFSTPEQLAEQAGITLLAFEQSGRLLPPQYPNSFSIAINRQVARSLGIAIGSETEIRARMKKGLNHDSN
jgi:putative ABC transport system substrate-binding protein